MSRSKHSTARSQKGCHPNQFHVEYLAFAPAFSITEDNNPTTGSEWDDYGHNSTPFLRIVTSLPLLAVITTVPAMLTVLGGPGAADQYSLAGALVAAVITLVGVRKFDQTAMNSVCAVLGSVTIGVSGPGTLVALGQWKGLVDDHTYNFITWHTWTLMGLVCGLTGWLASQSIYNISNKIVPTMAEWLGRKISNFFSPPTDK